MILVISGSRSLTSYDFVKKVIDEGVAELVNHMDEAVTELYSGHARGVDLLAERWAKENGIPVKTFIPDWNIHGKKAGILRNEEMANAGDVILAVWDGESRGTKHMIDYAKKTKKVIFWKDAINNFAILNDWREYEDKSLRL